MPQYRLDCSHHFHQNTPCAACHEGRRRKIVTTDTIDIGEVGIPAARFR
ncbi:MAG: hypothetical protein ISR77_03495 [Pirellulaceae bacterium]|nr:hypothetical protein [Pirellulaceae bacterium]